MIVVSDTSPINYLVLIEEIDLLPKLFGQVIIPPAVAVELQNAGTPGIVRDLIVSSPEWLKIQKPSSVDLSIALGAGEREVISLTKEMNADLALIDDRKARKIAIGHGLNVTGTLNILESAAKRRMIDPKLAFQKLKQTNFRIAPELLKNIFTKNQL
jgi:predicted nucleic acid-binding protein